MRMAATEVNNSMPADIGQGADAIYVNKTFSLVGGGIVRIALGEQVHSKPWVLPHAFVMPMSTAMEMVNSILSTMKQIQEQEAPTKTENEGEQEDAKS
jgi:hypothetical protein